MHRERSKKKREKERTNARHFWRAECLAECIAVIRRRFEVYAWASSTPPIRYSRRRSRMGKQTLLPSPPLPVLPPFLPSPGRIQLGFLFRRSKRAKREPPIFSYRILVCVHARRAINGKILESRSRNPDAGSRFSWVGFTTTLIGPFLPSLLASLYLQSLPSLLHAFIPLSFSHPTLPGHFIN